MSHPSSLPLVSICMPAYNAASYIEATIQSILAQSYSNIEIIIVNDGSSDDTENIIKKYTAGNRIRLINSNRGGQCAAANLAFRHSQGDLIKFFDADDLLGEYSIEVQVRRLLDAPNSIAAGQIKRFYNDDPSNALHEPLATWQDLDPMDWLLIDNGKGLGMMQAGMFLIPRQILMKSGLWNESLSLINDFEFFPRVILSSDRVLFTEEAKVFYRSGMANSLSSTNSRQKLASACSALELTTDHLLKHEDSDRVRSVLFFFWDMWSQIFYLDEMNLYRKARQRMKQLGNYSNTFGKDVSGIVKLIGWKNKKRIERLIKRRP